MLQTVEEIKNNIIRACAVSGAHPREVTIVAASKAVPPNRLSGLQESGIFICGENRVQELLQKHGRVDTTWHFIGNLQTNKVKYIVDKVDLIQSLDRIPLAAELEKRCVVIGRTMECLVEINIASEPTKSGISPDGAESFLRELQKFPHVKAVGLMTVAPVQQDFSLNRRYYLQMKHIYDKLKENPEFSDLRILSMGMSDDYALAVECGSNMVRLGRALFGERV